MQITVEIKSEVAFFSLKILRLIAISLHLKEDLHGAAKFSVDSTICFSPFYFHAFNDHERESRRDIPKAEFLHLCLEKYCFKIKGTQGKTNFLKTCIFTFLVLGVDCTISTQFGNMPHRCYGVLYMGSIWGPMDPKSFSTYPLCYHFVEVGNIFQDIWTSFQQHSLMWCFMSDSFCHGLPVVPNAPSNYMEKIFEFSVDKTTEDLQQNAVSFLLLSSS